MKMKVLMKKLSGYDKVFTNSRELQRTYLKIQRLNEEIVELSRVLYEKKNRKYVAIRKKLKTNFLRTQTRRDNIRHFLTQEIIKRGEELNEKSSHQRFENLFYFVLAVRRNYPGGEKKRKTFQVSSLLGEKMKNEMEMAIKRKKLKVKMESNNSEAFLGFKMMNIGIFWDSHGLVRIENLEEGRWEEILAIPCAPPFFSQGRSSQQPKQKRYLHHYVLEKLHFLAEQIVGMNVNYEYSTQRTNGKSLTGDEFNTRIFPCFSLFQRLVLQDEENSVYSYFMTPVARSFILTLHSQIQNTNISSLDLSTTRYLELPTPLLEFIAKHHPNKFLIHGTKIIFRKHSELDDFYYFVVKKIPDFESQYLDLYLLLRGYDTSFWCQIQKGGRGDYSKPSPSGCPFRLVKMRPVSNMVVFQSTSRFTSSLNQIRSQMKSLRESLQNLKSQTLSLRNFFLKRIGYIDSVSRISNFRFTSFQVLRIYFLRAKIQEEKKYFNQVIKKKLISYHFRNFLKIVPKSIVIRINLRLERRRLSEIKRKFVSSMQAIQKTYDVIKKFVALKTEFMRFKKKEKFKIRQILNNTFWIHKKIGEGIENNNNNNNNNNNRGALSRSFFQEMIGTLQTIRKYNEEIRRSVFFECNKIDEPITSTSLNDLKKKCRESLSMISEFVRFKIIEKWKALLNMNNILDYNDREVFSLLLKHLPSYFSRFWYYKENMEENSNLVYFGELKIDFTQHFSYDFSNIYQVCDGIGFLLVQYQRRKKSDFSNFLSRSERNRYQVLYEGQWKNSKKNGRGVLFFHHSSSYSNLSQSVSVSVSSKVQSTRNGKLMYEGQFVDDRMEGYGVKFIEKLVQEKDVRGFFKNGRLVDKSLGLGKLERFDKKELIGRGSRVIGKGSFGLIYGVVWMRRKYAVKLYHTNVLSGKEKKLRGLGKRLVLLSHPNVIQSYGLVCEKGVGEKKEVRDVGVLMEYVKDGRNVDHLILEWKMENRNSLRVMFKKLVILYECAKGVEYIHSKNLIHGDMKWGNIIIRDDGKNEEDMVVKIIDFDQLREDESIWKYKGVGGLGGTATGTGQLFEGGTIEFLAPESMGGAFGAGPTLTRKVDVYSFGVMLFSLLFHKNNPFEDMTRCAECHERLIFPGQTTGKNLPVDSFPNIQVHVKNCNLRPHFKESDLIENLKSHQEKIIAKKLIRLMIECWDSDLENRPSFRVIRHRLGLLIQKMESFEPQEERKEEQEDIAGIIEEDDPRGIFTLMDGEDEGEDDSGNLRYLERIKIMERIIEDLREKVKSGENLRE